MGRKFYSFTILTVLVFFGTMCTRNKSRQEKFWEWFSKNEKHIYENVESEKLQKQIFNDISSQLAKIDQNLVFEFSPIRKNNIREFSISADGIKESFPSVENLIKSSPKLTNWKFSAFRQRVPNDNYEIQYKEYNIGYDDIFYRYSTSNNEFGIELNIKNYDGSAGMQDAIYVLLDGLLGEYDVVMNINWIDWKKLDENESNKLHNLIELRALIDSRK
ncbi:hypothetical protein [Chryseobacterium herbae]|uniref:Lipoprotein n=1 Tax=Chryseobacterium herbae TaxID=2976476 RepID=A0ABT2ISK2_9FLAO|nr:hypothetical protein [Chryseobacterium sp. pc1-10]MCT2561811.1 hypothetical protein [Chryseobacterium sp. pc1-10]